MPRALSLKREAAKKATQRRGEKKSEFDLKNHFFPHKTSAPLRNCSSRAAFVAASATRLRFSATLDRFSCSFSRRAKERDEVLLPRRKTERKEGPLERSLHRSARFSSSFSTPTLSPLLFFSPMPPDGRTNDFLPSPRAGSAASWPKSAARQRRASQPGRSCRCCPAAGRRQRRRRQRAPPPPPLYPSRRPLGAAHGGLLRVCAAAYALPLEGRGHPAEEHSPLNSAVAGGSPSAPLLGPRSGGGGGAAAAGMGLASPLLFVAGLGAAAAASLSTPPGTGPRTGGASRGLCSRVLGLLDPPKRLVREREAAAAAAAEVERRQARNGSGCDEEKRSSSSSSPASIVGVPLHPWLEWLPIRKLTPEEAALRKLLKEDEFRENARLAAEGGMPSCCCR